MGALVRYNINISQAEVLLIGTALEALPFGKVAKLFTNIQNQIIEQDKAAADKAAADKDKGEQP